MTATMSTVVIVGAGPAAVSLVERLVANRPQDTRVDVHLVDPHPPGSGRIWRADQSPLMRMNSMAADVTMFLDETSTATGPVVAGPTLAEWVRTVPADELRDPSLLPLIRSVTPTTFPDRRVQGEYLAWVLARAACDGGSDVVVHCHEAEVVDVADGAPQTVALSNGGRILADVVVFALGHVDVEPQTRDDRPGARHIAPAYSADVPWSELGAGEDVLVNGLGLAFVDIALLLTEGRGGRFTARPDGRLDYHPSGAEPVLWAGSRRGVVHHAKTGYPLQGPRPPLPALFTGEVVERLTARGGLDFRRDVWPWIAADVRFAHHHELFHAHPDRVAGTWEQVEALLRRVDPATGQPVDDDAVDALVPDPTDRLDLQALDRPLQGVTFADLDAAQEFVTSGVEADVVRRRDPRYSADLGAFLGLLTSYVQVARLVQVGAFAPVSLLVDVDGWWKGWFSHLASGPPPDRALQLAALARAGVIRFVGRLTGARRDGSTWVATTPSVPGAEVRAGVLVEARLPRPHVGRAPGPLLRRLLERGAVSEEVLESADGTEVTTGLLRVDPVGRVLRADGRADPDRFAVGILTTARAAAAFSRPQTDAATFRTTDALARAVLERLVPRA
ncbi:FAD/NAD(P)-binding protein [Jatrophihabitans sp. YIM 134969]